MNSLPCDGIFIRVLYVLFLSIASHLSASFSRNATTTWAFARRTHMLIACLPCSRFYYTRFMNASGLVLERHRTFMRATLLSRLHCIHLTRKNDWVVLHQFDLIHHFQSEYTSKTFDCATGIEMGISQNFICSFDLLIKSLERLLLWFWIRVARPYTNCMQWSNQGLSTPSII